MPLEYHRRQHHWNDNFQPRYTPWPSWSLFFWGMCSAPFSFSSAGILWNRDLKLTLLLTKQQVLNVVNITETITSTPDIPLDPLDHCFSKVCAVLCFLRAVLVSGEIVTWNSPFYSFFGHRCWCRCRSIRLPMTWPLSPCWMFLGVHPTRGSGRFWLISTEWAPSMVTQVLFSFVNQQGVACLWFKTRSLHLVPV